MSKENILVIGGGITGLTSAYYLAKSGWKVTLVDKGDLRDNCSYGNAGMIVPSHFTPMAAPGIVAQGIKWMFDSKSPFYVKPSPSWSLISWGLKFLKHANEKHVARTAPAIRDLNLYSSMLYHELATELEKDFDLHHKGILMLYKNDKTAEEEIHLSKTALELGLDTVVLNRDEVQAMEPHTEVDVLGAVHYRCDGHLYPPALMNLLISTLKELGVQIKTGALVDGFEVRSGKIVKTILSNGQTIASDQVVLTGGAWLGQLAKKAGLAVPIMPGKGYSFMVEPSHGEIVHPSLLIEARVAITPMGGKIRVGGTMELAAVDHKVNLNRVKGIVESVPKYYPLYELSVPEISEIWHGFRPCSPDGLPYLGYSKNISNLVLAGGLGMMGLSLGPAVGHTVADLVNGQRTHTDIRLFDPERFN